MLSTEIQKLEKENFVLRKELQELKKKMDENQIPKPRSCQYCRNFMQHYIKGNGIFTKEYIPIYAGHCTCGAPVSKGKKRNPKPDDSCPYFELGTSGSEKFL